MKHRILRFGLATLIGLGVPVAVMASGPSEASKGLGIAAQHAQGKVPTTVGTDKDKPETAGERPHNHGWFVSQVAKDSSATAKSSQGVWTHGAAVAAAAKSDEGKPSAATSH